jgi:hypothetical protein
MTAPNTAQAERAPYLTLGESLTVVQQIHEQGGGGLSLESLSPILGNSARSSSFTRKLAALRGFGMVDISAERVALNQLGLAYVAPTAAAERSQAIAQAFRNVPLARQIHDRFGGGLLPSREILANLLLREYGASDPNHQRWAEFIIEGLGTAGLLSQVGGRVSVLSRTTTAPDPDPIREVPSAPGAGSGGSPAHVQVPQVGGSPDSHRVELPLADGEKAVVVLPKNATGEDIDDVIAMLQIMKKRAARGRAG